MKAGLITGASSGIGKELARIHASKGHNVLLVARRKEKLEELSREINQQFGVACLTYAIDLSDKEAVKGLVDEIRKAGIQVNYLFNNAGFGGWGAFSNRSEIEDANMIEVNIQALTYLMHAFIPDMIKHGEGKILNTASTAGFIPGPLQATYFATKSYVVSLTKATNFELRNTPVTVTALCPGPVKTEFDQVAGMGKSEMFDKAADAYSTAKKGYDAMMKGKTIIISEFGYSILIKYLAPFIPDRFVMKMVEKIQSK